MRGNANCPPSLAYQSSLNIFCNFAKSAATQIRFTLGVDVPWEVSTKFEHIIMLIATIHLVIRNAC